MDVYLGEIKLVGFSFAPLGWLPCDGRLLSIVDNEALYLLLGTIYGGDGVTNFALPDLRGRAAFSRGRGSSLTDYAQGEEVGHEQVTLIPSQIPLHAHALAVDTATGTAHSPNGNRLATVPYAVGNAFAPSPDSVMPADAVEPAGGSLPHENRQPFTVLNYIIAVEGIYPSVP